MVNRRLMLGLSACLILALAYFPAVAQGWKPSYPELVLAVTPAENPGDVTERFEPIAKYLTDRLGVTVRLKTVPDYASVIEGQRSGQFQIAYYGPASYVRAYLSGVKTEPFAVEVNIDGSRVHRSVLYVKRESRFEKIEDLKGASIALVDPDSMSGSIVPSIELNNRNIDPKKFFGNIIYAGSHENAILDLKNGTADVCANRWSSEGKSILRRMEDKGIPGVRYTDYRIIYISDPIPNAPIAYLSSLPADLKKEIREAFLNIEMNDKAAFDKFADGKFLPWEPVTHREYKPVAELIKSLDELSKQRTPPAEDARDSPPRPALLHEGKAIAVPAFALRPRRAP